MSIFHTPPDLSKVPGGWQTDETPILLGCKAAPQTQVLARHVYRIHNFLSSKSVEAIKTFMAQAPAITPVSIQGLQKIESPEDIGSWRTTMYNRSFAGELERLFKHVNFPRNLYCEDTTSTDWWQGDKNRKEWDYVGISPLSRFMKYMRVGANHLTHYDSSYIYSDDNYRTLYSFVLYLSTNKTGATRIIEDGQKNLPIWQRNHSDWNREAKEEEVVVRSLPVAGDLLVFHHRIPHDVEKFIPQDTNDERIIIRGDLIFKAANV